MPSTRPPVTTGDTAGAGTLDSVPSGRAVTVTATRGDTGLVRRLAELGVRRGESVLPLHRTAGGGRLVAVGDSRVALAREVLRAVDVAEDVAEDVEPPASPGTAAGGRS